MMDAFALAELMTAEIVAQGCDVDNLGDAESIVLLDDVATINMLQLAERVLAKLKEGQ
jgi:hypothetical protein